MYLPTWVSLLWAMKSGYQVRHGGVEAQIQRRTLLKKSNFLSKETSFLGKGSFSSAMLACKEHHL
jgi:hypothetical protein